VRRLGGRIAAFITYCLVFTFVIGASTQANGNPSPTVGVCALVIAGVGTTISLCIGFYNMGRNSK
jgi:hypothetical protein